MLRWDSAQTGNTEKQANSDNAPQKTNLQSLEDTQVGYTLEKYIVYIFAEHCCHHTFSSIDASIHPIGIWRTGEIFSTRPSLETFLRPGVSKSSLEENICKSSKQLSCKHLQEQL